MERLFAHLSSIHPLSQALQEQLLVLLKEKEIEKKSFLLKSGHICRSIYFIDKGLFRCFYMKDEKEVCSWFMKEGDVIISVQSFFQQVTSIETIEALEDGVVYYVTYEELQYLYKTFPEFNYVGRVLTEQYYILCEQRLYSIRMQRAAERYQYLLDHFPELILRVPSKYIASYLSITEETLSRIRNKIKT